MGVRFYLLRTSISFFLSMSQLVDFKELKVLYGSIFKHGKGEKGKPSFLRLKYFPYFLFFFSPPFLPLLQVLRQVERKLMRIVMLHW